MFKGLSTLIAEIMLSLIGLLFCIMSLFGKDGTMDGLTMVFYGCMCIGLSEVIGLLRELKKKNKDE